MPKRYSPLLGREVDDAPRWRVRRRRKSLPAEQALANTITAVAKEIAPDALVREQVRRLFASIDKLPDIGPVDAPPSLRERLGETLSGLQILVEEISGLEAAQQSQAATIADLRVALDQARASRNLEDLWRSIDRLPDPDAPPKPLLKHDARGRIVAFTDARGAEVPLRVTITARDPNGHASLMRMKAGTDEFDVRILRDLNNQAREFSFTPIAK